MYWRDVGNLCKTATNPDGSAKLDSLRKPVKEFERHQVFCNKKPVRQSEFYQAQAQGMRSQYMFEINTIDYDEEQYFEYTLRGKTKMLRITRADEKRDNPEITELVCTVLVADNG